MIYVQNIGLNKANKEVLNEHLHTPVKMQQRRQAFNEVSQSFYLKSNQASTTISSTKKNNQSNNASRLNQSFNSFAQSKIHSPKRLSVHRSSLTPSMILKQTNDQFYATKNYKSGQAMRLSQMSVSLNKNECNLVHIDDILESYRKSPSRKNELKKQDINQNQMYQQSAETFNVKKEKQNFYADENMNIEFQNLKINEKLKNLNHNQIDFIKPNRPRIDKIKQSMDLNSNSISLQNNIPDSIESNMLNMPSIVKSSTENMNNFLNEIDPETAFNSYQRANTQDDFLAQSSKQSTNYERRQNSISGYAIFKSSNTPLNPSYSQMDDDLSKPSLSTTSNYFRIQKRNNPFKRFYKTDQKLNQNNLYRYIDTQNENTPTKLSQGAFQNLIQKKDSHFQSKQSDEINIFQYYNPTKNNMSNLVDGEGKVYKKHYMLSLQLRLEELKKQKIQNEAQMMMINYNLINEIEQTSKLLYKQMPTNQVKKFGQIIDSIKQNIYQNSQNQKQNLQNQQIKQRRSSSQNSSYIQDQSQYEDGEEIQFIMNQKLQTEM
ncbi:hypothetical protein TTHERM_00112750 (macronuclear) [Tetrahymena thermophila SB210]|uniref:Uncharacterized protein n=1 Tax=Tetrahymena thermophila (strain SB210) TaxID=312017 RepID=Q22Z96_TETTS|nr:hypothetical protein TTHERM_00112750 [Tetrahymena thermophila SB210]EAR90425.2 hypothetical protein TTHERM_00112750 [Tetrahymena thermophila SB210]|eukprot:XP_001010670.2 hypothetical protein TTHERM_00112750 [Tetrahymena thermophila SB210]